MKLYTFIFALIGVSLLVLRVFFNETVTIDGLTILIYFIFSIPVIGKFVKTAKFLGNEFTFFNESINKFDSYVTDLKSKNNVAQTKKENAEDLRDTFDLTLPKMLLKTDHKLALASLRIEIEKKIRLLSRNWYTDVENMPLNKMLYLLAKNNKLLEKELLAIKEVVSICNKAIHSEEITLDQSKKVIRLMSDLNNNLHGGYSLNMLPNKDFDNQGYYCEFEHCIENMPFAEKENDARSCPMFGHMCPGGISFVARCKEIFKKN